jgi:hypothetical protein
LRICARSPDPATGSQITLGDVAGISMNAKSTDSLSRYNGMKAHPYGDQKPVCGLRLGREESCQYHRGIPGEEPGYALSADL